MKQKFRKVESEIRNTPGAISTPNRTNKYRAVTCASVGPQIGLSESRN